MNRRPLYLIVVTGLLIGCSATALVAMQRGWGQRGEYRDPNYRGGVPIWDQDEAFKSDCFTFARVIYNSGGGYRGGRWDTDYPDSDHNFSLRLQQLTSLKVNPYPKQLELTDPSLFDYPFLYMIEVGSMSLDQSEIEAMRKYCMNGGFIMVDDFWGDRALENFIYYMSLVFPEIEPEDVPLEHEIFHSVYDLTERPQIPSMHHWQGSGQTWEWNHDYGAYGHDPHYLSIADEDGRLMVLICHNTDLGDGWEREGEDRGYFEEFAVKKSYPLGINIVTYAMTH